MLGWINTVYASIHQERKWSVNARTGISHPWGMFVRLQECWEFLLRECDLLKKIYPMDEALPISPLQRFTSGRVGIHIFHGLHVNKSLNNILKCSNTIHSKIGIWRISKAKMWTRQRLNFLNFTHQTQTWNYLRDISSPQAMLQEISKPIKLQWQTNKNITFISEETESVETRYRTRYLSLPKMTHKERRRKILQ